MQHNETSNRSKAGIVFRQRALHFDSSIAAPRFHRHVFAGTLRIFIHRRNAMFEGIFQPTHLIIIAGIALLIFGPK